MSLDRLREQIEAEIAELYPDALGVDVRISVRLPMAEQFVRIEIVPPEGSTQ